MIYIFDNEQFILMLDNQLPNGLPLLSAILKEQINGEVSLTFSVPADHPDNSIIHVGQWAIVKDTDGLFRAFTITEEESTHDDNGLQRTFYTEELAINELSDHIIEDKRPTNTSASAALTTALQGTRWSIGTISDFGNNSTNFYYEDALSAIEKVMDVWGGEIRFRITLNSNNEISGRYVDLVSQVGTDRGKRFEYAKDLLSIERQVDMKSLKTALYGRGKGEEVGEGFGRRLTFADVEWKISNGNPANKPKGQEWIEDPQAKTSWGHWDNAGNKQNRMGVFVDEEETNATTLLQKTWDHLQSIKQPLVSYKMGVLDLERVSSQAYQHEAVRLGDHCAVIDREFNPPVSIGARIVEVERDLLEPSNSAVVVGNVIQDMSNLTKDIKRDLDNKMGRHDPISWLEGILDTARNEVWSRNGYVYITDADGILVTNRPIHNIDNPPDKALMLKGGVFAIANSLNPDGSFNWRTFGDGDGFIADLIVAGTMLADRIRGGEYYVGGSVNGIGKDGKLFMLSAEDEIVCQLDALTRGFDQLFVGTISGNNVVTRTTQGLSYYVDPVNGSDNNDGLSTGQAVQSFDKVIDSLPSEINHIIDIYVIGDTPPTWSEEVFLSGKTGGGILRFHFDGATLHGHFKAISCSCIVEILDGKIVHTGTIMRWDSNPWACIHAVSCTWVLVDNMILDANNLAWAGVRATASNCFVRESELYNGTNYLIWSHDLGRVRPTNNVGNGSPYGMRAGNGGTIGGYGTAPQGTTQNTLADTGGEIRGTYTFTAGTTPAVPSQSTLKTWNATGFKSWDTVYGWNSDYPTQGNPGNWGPSGTHRGLYFFDYANIASALSGKTISRIRVKLQRNTGSGYYDSRPVYFWTHNLAEATGGQPALGNSAGNLANFKSGESKWVELPISFGNALKDGTVKGIAIYADPASQANYVRMARTAQLEINYQ